MDNIIKKLAAKYDMSEEIIEKAVRSQFNFVASTMQQGEFESVHLHYLGKFAVKPNALDRVTKMTKNKNKYAK